MAKASGRKTSSSAKRGRSSSNKGKGKKTSAADRALFGEIGLIILFVAMIIVFLCNFGLIGSVGDGISSVLFGLFGFLSYIFPLAVFFGVAFWYANVGTPAALRKLLSGAVLFLVLDVICDMIWGNAAGLVKYGFMDLYESSVLSKGAGGAVGGSISYFLQHYLGMVGAVLVVILFGVVSLILMTERSLVGALKSGGDRVRERSRQDADERREAADQHREENLARWEESQERKQQRALERQKREEARALRSQEREDEKVLRVDRKVSGVTADTSLSRPSVRQRDDIHEITLEDLGVNEQGMEDTTMDISPQVHIHSMHESSDDMAPDETEEIREEEITGNYFHEEPGPAPEREEITPPEHQEIRVHSEASKNVSSRSASTRQAAVMSGKSTSHKSADDNKKYAFPPLSLLNKGTPAAVESENELKQTAMRLQQTLNTFGVGVTVTDISQGPTVTRYELAPEQGVKVSKIVNLADDIKLSLAVTDIRIEAPIPGKSAVGIEVPNKEISPVALRDILESREFKEFPSDLAFAVGKDIAGQVVVADIAKMPHLLIAGATGSGKSVCINTIIMSILYKAHPDDVKMIMIDPKVVELSVYNGIPHLLVPVVTDPKKAAAALQWGVTEMTERYRKFADFNVRDIQGYNKKVESMKGKGQEDAPAKMPRIVIIVDELADLMMTSPGEVEESICRLAQLARAAGIHLIIATQRPSVDVITGLIKANMPSRISFAVSSGVDSRTILDMVGAEKLLGKGDMFFYPQGYAKPARVQGAFVSDREVSDVVDFIKNQTTGDEYARDVEEQLKGMESSSSSDGSADERDEYFAEAGRFIIEKDKASIGSLQRLLKIGFNRAARIMDQLAQYGVVGEEEGTKPRKVLMTMEEFEQLLEELG